MRSFKNTIFRLVGLDLANLKSRFTSKDIRRIPFSLINSKRKTCQAESPLLMKSLFAICSQSSPWLPGGESNDNRLVP